MQLYGDKVYAYAFEHLTDHNLEVRESTTSIWGRDIHGECAVIFPLFLTTHGDMEGNFIETPCAMMLRPLRDKVYTDLVFQDPDEHIAHVIVNVRLALPQELLEEITEGLMEEADRQMGDPYP